MSELVRTSIAMERELYDRMEELLADGPFENRSEFIRDLVRERLVREEWDKNERVLGTVTIIYNHDTPDLTNRLVALQHEVHGMILASTHVHLDHCLCAEVIIALGEAGSIQRFAETIRQQRGVMHAALSTSTAGATLPMPSREGHTHFHQHEHHHGEEHHAHS